MVTLILSAYAHIPGEAIADLYRTRDEGAYSLAVLEALSPFQPRIEEILGQQMLESGQTAARELALQLAAEYRAVGKAEAPLPSQAVLNFSFDRTSPTALSAAQNQAGSMITNMVDSQRQAARQLVASAYQQGRTPAQLASDLRQFLSSVKPGTEAGKWYASSLGLNVNGLTARYEQAVANFANRQAGQLIKDGIIGTKAEKILKERTQKYADKLRRSRAKTISRTELLRASNAGRLEAFQQAQQKGLTSPNAQKTWATSRFDVCEICVPLNGQSVPLNQPFSNGGQHPPAHPNCRCGITMNPNVALYEPPQSLGTGLPGDPLRTVFPGRTQLGQQLSSTPIGAPTVSTLASSQAPAPVPEPAPPAPAPAPAQQKPPARPARGQGSTLLERLGVDTADLVEDTGRGARLGGQNPKRVYTDTKTGRQYIFKEQESWQAQLEAECSKLADDMGLTAPKIEAITLDGKTGSLHEILSPGGKVDEIRAAYKGDFDPSLLSEAQVEALQKNQIFDYLISNNDAHQDQFIRLATGQDSSLLPIGIDKGQAFKHLLRTNDSRLLVNGFPGAPVYNPNNNSLTRQPYIRLWQRFFENGEVNVVLPSRSAGIRSMVDYTVRNYDEVANRFRPIFEAMERAGKLESAERAYVKFRKRLYDFPNEIKKMEAKILASPAGELRFSVGLEGQLGQILSELEPWQLNSRNYAAQTPDWWTKKSGVSAGRTKVPGAKDAITQYTGGESGTINRGLERSTIEYRKTGKLDQGFVRDEMDRYVRDIDGAMAQAAIPEDVLVYRGTGALTEYQTGANLSAADAQRLLGKTIVHDGFVSTSVKRETAFQSAIELQIKVPKGTRGLWVKPISRYTRENELLLDRGYRMLVTGVRKEGTKTILDVLVLPDEAVIPSIPGYTRVPV